MDVVQTLDFMCYDTVDNLRILWEVAEVHAQNIRNSKS